MQIKTLPVLVVLLLSLALIRYASADHNPGKADSLRRYVVEQDSNKLQARIWGHLRYRQQFLSKRVDSLQSIQSAIVKKEPSIFAIRTWEIASQQKKPSFIKRHLGFENWQKPALIFTAVVSNWLSFYLKREADDAYQRYRTTSDLSEMQRFYNRTRDLDHLSSMMLGVSVISLSGYFYLLITGD